MVGNHAASVNAKGSLTARLTSRAGAKAGVSDPMHVPEFTLDDRVDDASLNG